MLGFMEENESILDDVEGGDEEFCFGYEEAATGELIIVEKRGLSEVRICDERACSLQRRLLRESHVDWPSCGEKN